MNIKQCIFSIAIAINVLFISTPTTMKADAEKGKVATVILGSMVLGSAVMGTLTVTVPAGAFIGCGAGAAIGAKWGVLAAIAGGGAGIIGGAAAGVAIPIGTLWLMAEALEGKTEEDEQKTEKGDKEKQ